MAHRFVYDVDRVLHFMQELIPGLHKAHDMRVIGLERDGELVAGTAFEGFNGHNVWVHLAGLPGARWMTRDYLRACFAYAFEICAVPRLSGYANASNEQACRLNRHFGYTEEARLKAAAPDGSDVILFVMWRHECRFLKELHHG